VAILRFAPTGRPIARAGCVPTEAASPTSGRGREMEGSNRQPKRPNLAVKVECRAQLFDADGSADAFLHALHEAPLGGSD
jgi:hypothetical protein